MTSHDIIDYMALAAACWLIVDGIIVILWSKAHDYEDEDDADADPRST